MFQEQALISLVEPNNFAEARKNNDWINAMNDELDQIEKNQTWELVPRPKVMSVIGTKWILKYKFNENGQVIKNKDKLVCVREKITLVPWSYTLGTFNFFPCNVLWSRLRDINHLLIVEVLPVDHSE